MVNGISISGNNYIGLNNNKTEQVKGTEGNNISQLSIMPSAVSVDYNVRLPQSYTKLGIEKLSNGQEVHCYKLCNGQKVMIAPMPSPKTYVNTYVNTGALNEKDSERGISHFNEHMAFNGTFGTDGYMKLEKGDVFRKIAEMGGEANACTSMGETNYTIGIPQFEKDDLETAIRIQAAMMNNLEMSDEMVEKEHGPVCSEINMYSDYMGTKANNIAIKSLYNIQSTSEDLVAGRVDNIQKVDRQKVMDYYKNNYFPANMTTVITGNVNPDEAINLVAKHFRGENKPNPDRRFEKLTPIEKSVRKDIICDKAKQTYGTVAFNGPQANDLKSQSALDAALGILFLKSNSRLGTPLKVLNSEINPAYTKISTIPTDGMVVYLDIDSTEQNSEKVLKTIFEGLQNFKIKDEAELQQIKDMLKSKNQDHYENPELLNYMVGSGSLSLSVSDIAKQDKLIDELTIKDVEEAVHEYLNVNKASIAIVHPSSENAESLKLRYDNVNNNNKVSFKGRVQQQDELLPIDSSKITQFKLSNNYNIAFLDTPENTNARVNMRLKPLVPIKAKPGTEILLNRMLNSKTAYKDMDEFGDYLDKNNLVQSLSVENGGIIRINGKMPFKNIEQFMRITQEQLMLPFFDEETLEKQKEIVKDLLSNSEPQAFDGLNKVMYPDSSFGDTPQDVLDNIDSITLDDIKDYYSQIMNNSSATIAVAAPMADRTVMNKVMSLSSRMPAVKNSDYHLYELYKPMEKSKVVIQEVPNSQADIIEAYNFKHNGNVKDFTAFTLLNAILSNGDTNGLYNNLREKEKLAYMVYSEFGGDGDNGMIYCRISTTTDNNETGEHSYDNVKKSVNGFNELINKMKNGEFTDKELEVAKKSIKDRLRTYSYGQENSVRVLGGGMNTAYGPNHMNERYKAIDSITREDIQRAANYAFGGKPVYSIVASKDTLAANKEFLESLDNQ